MASGEAEQPSWPELLGSNNWESLLDPLDLPLRKLILRCGDFIQATYDAFNNDQNSKCLHFCTAPPELVSLKRFCYALCRGNPGTASLIGSGYIAVTSDERSKALGRREIYVAWRGTTRNYEWINVLDAELESVESLLKNSTLGAEERDGSSDSDDDKKVPKVMQGWLTIYTSDNPKSSFTKLSARTQLLEKIKELRERYPDEKLNIILTGHSLGASLSILSAFDLAENGVNDIPVTAIVFGSPQVGNKAFSDRLKSHQNLKVLHVRNIVDLITRYPGPLLGYKDTGIDLVIDTRKSPSLKDSRNPSDWHNLQAMLHVVAGWNGQKGEFELKVKRSLALVNKSCEFLKDELLVPGSWWVEKNRGMVRDENGEWALAPPADEDLPVPEF
ncbi:Phospholipase A1 [Melia azedarach]|uniref:Phospholipase A1 n=1 Tax=Melia azedarach TaxID=155640 RepID=A0ACC1Z2L9_MELAZ|nr:Phospholipase A1 [Melia azedarach]